MCKTAAAPATVLSCITLVYILDSSVPDPNMYVFGPLVSGSVSHRYESRFQIRSIIKQNW
jgi:hypothetical protein